VLLSFGMLYSLCQGRTGRCRGGEAENTGRSPLARKSEKGTSLAVQEGPDPHLTAVREEKMGTTKKGPYEEPATN